MNLSPPAGAEAIVFEVLIIAMVVLAPLLDAPLEQLANPAAHAKSAKAPWYFLRNCCTTSLVRRGIILIPTLGLVALIMIPYFHVNVEGKPSWEKKRRSASRRRGRDA